MPSEATSQAPNHILEFPGGYTRSVGPVIGRFLSELRDGNLVGVRTRAGRVLFPPLEYDPDTGDAVTGEFVPVGPVGTVTTWSWVAHPRAEHPLDRPFAWALIRPDGADTAILHALDAGVLEPGAAAPKHLRTGMRVRAQWKDDRVGDINDIAAFRPEVTMITAPTRLAYRLKGGRALDRFLEGISEGRIIGHRCPVCEQVIVPMKGLCPRDGVPTSEEVELPHTGTVTTFAVNNLPDPRAPEVPFVSAYILLDGADLTMLTLVAGIPADQVRMGMRVKAAWKPREEWGRTMANIRWFEPLDEPDVPFDAIKDYL
ncbi:Zn-ribbon domain-containing OB-fold protein [Actinomadura parmotrematis]|uniref:OB-fold domain-containing protein n=1 Tax=Actinomadura parmotrematis TaxID=2864039 RepID=A0ABS7G4W9_9ACTN|nr:OB-fold nucleic acid binding domain-containing protein [Actinomadura parmotrematis]MBW8487576.1 OB-fold domain-containing protein [Actinomadura parmotrematis]